MNLLGAIQSPYDPRDWRVAMTLAPEPPMIPVGFRLTTVSSMPPVYEQAGPTCVTSSTCGVAEFHERVESGGSTRLNDDRMYTRCKELDGYPGDGTYPRVALEVWRNEGIYTDADRGPDHFRIQAYYSVPVNAYEIARVIYEKKQPVLIAMEWPTNWTGSYPTGIMPDPSAGSPGGHQEWAWGYDFTQPERGILMRGSWGKLWSLNGNHWMGEKIWPRVWEAWYAESA